MARRDGAGEVVAVIGGGVSGLAAARVLAGLEPVSAEAGEAHARSGARRRAGQVVVFEASERFGGKVRTGTIAGMAVELGPDQFLRRDPSAERLCRHLGLGEDLVAPGARTAGVYSHGEMRGLPRGLVLGVPTDLDAVAESGIVTEAGVEQARQAALAAAGGPPIARAEVGLGQDDPEADDAPGDGAGGERSAGAILRPRLGDEVVDRLVDPLLGGINAGSVDAMSLGVAAPQIASALVGQRDVMSALAALVPPPAPVQAPQGAPSTRPGSPFFGLRGGLGRMVDACVAELRGAGVELRPGTPVRGIRRHGPGWQVEHAGGTLDCDGIVLALPAWAAQPLLKAAVPLAADVLARIDHASVAVLNLAYPASSVSLPSEWTGVLVPRVEGTLMTAATWLSVKWPWMSSERLHLVRVSAGRAGDDRISWLTDDDLACELAGEVERLIGHGAHPVEWHVTRWDRSFPQYRPGHRSLVGRLTRLLSAEGGIGIAGAALGGIGVPACITSGERGAMQLGGGPWT